MTFIIWDVEIIHLPGALVVGQVSPLDQVVHITIFIKTTKQKTAAGFYKFIILTLKNKLI